MIAVAVIAFALVLIWLLPPVAVAAILFGVCAVLSLVRPRDGRESVARLESPSASRAPAAVERSRRGQ